LSPKLALPRHEIIFTETALQLPDGNPLEESFTAIRRRSPSRPNARLVDCACTRTWRVRLTSAALRLRRREVGPLSSAPLKAVSDQIVFAARSHGPGRRENSCRIGAFLGCQGVVSRDVQFGNRSVVGRSLIVFAGRRWSAASLRPFISLAARSASLFTGRRLSNCCFLERFSQLAPAPAQRGDRFERVAFRGDCSHRRSLSPLTGGPAFLDQRCAGGAGWKDLASLIASYANKLDRLP